MNPVGCRNWNLTRKQPVSKDGVSKTHSRSHDPEQFEAQCTWPFQEKVDGVREKKVITNVVGSISV